MKDSAAATAVKNVASPCRLAFDSNLITMLVEPSTSSAIRRPG
jgi:hypothetical protein